MPRMVALALVPMLLAPSAMGAEKRYRVDAAQSQVRVHVGRAGLLKFAGHEHTVAAPVLDGEVAANPDRLAGSSVSLTFAAAAMTVLPEGEPEGDVPKVEAAMRGEKLLEVGRFPRITFRSESVAGRAVSAGVYDLEVTGDMTIHGVVRRLKLPLRVEVSGESLVATGRTTLRHGDFGLTPISVAGVVKVKNEIGVAYRIVARAIP